MYTCIHTGLMSVGMKAFVTQSVLVFMRDRGQIVWSDRLDSKTCNRLIAIDCHICLNIYDSDLVLINPDLQRLHLCLSESKMYCRESKEIQTH